MSAHTPGPWVQHPSYPWIIKEDMRPIAAADDGVTICSTMAHESGGFFPSPDQGRANARLIAAAPELLEALQALRLAREQNKYLSWEKGVPDFNRAEAMADAAIAKATGADA